MTAAWRSIPPTIVLLAVSLLRTSAATAELSLSLGAGRQSAPGFGARPGGGALDVHLDPFATGQDAGEMIPKGPTPGVPADLNEISSGGLWISSTISPPVIEGPSMELSTITPSLMAIAPWGVTATIAPPMGPPPVLSAPRPALPASIAGDRPSPGDGQTGANDPADEDEGEAKQSYIKPANQVAGTAVLFLILGLIFLKGRHDVESA